MDRKTLAYWLCTGLFCLVLGFSGVAHFTRQTFIVEALAALGYPVYVLTILGTAKLLGVAALLAPRRPLLKEWAYAGFASISAPRRRLTRSRVIRSAKRCRPK